MSNQAIYRFVLREGAGATQERQFKRSVALLNQPSSGWVVHKDWIKPGEQEALKGNRE